MSRLNWLNARDRCRRVLVVEDEDDIRELVRYNLEQEGFAVEDAAMAARVTSRSGGVRRMHWCST